MQHHNAFRPRTESECFRTAVGYSKNSFKLIYIYLINRAKHHWEWDLDIGFQISSV